VRVFCAIALAFSALVFAGCSGVQRISPVTSPQNSVPGVSLQGRVHGGQGLIVGASLYLYAADTTGYGGPGIAASALNASTSLLSSGSKDGAGNYYVTTDSNGAFSITGDYTCPSATTQVYLYAVGGDPGTGANSAAGLLAGLGSCGNLKPSTYIVINEVSTIATAYAIAGFASDATHVSSSGSALALTNVANAFATITNLETLNTGLALATTPAGNGTLPQAEIDTLANILAACVNSTGPASTGCTALFSSAMNGLTAPTDTATAAINIAHNPGANITALYALQTANSPFQPTLTAAPNDFTVGISFTGAGLDNPESVVIDAAGNVWLGNGNTPSISKFSNLGAAISGSDGYTGGGLGGVESLAIDASGSLWVTNFFVNSSFADVYGLVEFSSTGAPISGGISGFTGGGLDLPEGVAIDASGNVWIVDHASGSLSEFDSSGNAISGSSGYFVTGSYLTGVLVIDTSGDFWSDNTFTTISEVTLPGVGLTETPYSCCDLYNPGGIAIDPSGNLWVVNWTLSSEDIVELSSTGSPISVNGGYTGGGINFPRGIASDGAGNIWISNVGTRSLSELNSSGSAISPSTGYQGGQIYGDIVAIDGSGNLWTPSDSGNLEEVVGAATPVVTPVVANLMPPYTHQAVNKP
jgi:streptogramin lyase